MKTSYMRTPIKCKWYFWNDNIKYEVWNLLIFEPTKYDFFFAVIWVRANYNI